MPGRKRPSPAASPRRRPRHAARPSRRRRGSRYSRSVAPANRAHTRRARALRLERLGDAQETGLLPPRRGPQQTCAVTAWPSKSKLTHRRDGPRERTC
eukprot:6175619-Pleurochrysis_carterae.AAC.2